jgi:hypothetical protein
LQDLLYIPCGAITCDRPGDDMVSGVKVAVLPMLSTPTMEHMTTCLRAIVEDQKKFNKLQAASTDALAYIEHEQSTKLTAAHMENLGEGQPRAFVFCCKLPVASPSAFAWCGFMFVFV